VLCSEAPDCIPLVFAALRENRITDTMWRQKLADIGRGCYRGMFAASGAWIPLNYSLEAVGKRHGVAKRGDDPWRLRYAELEHVPSAQWPPEAISYALGDIEATRAAYLGQSARYAPELFVDEYAQMRAFFAAELTSGWGLRTSPEGVRQFEAGVRAEFDEIQAILVEHELVRPNGSKDTKRAKARMLEALGEAGVRRTPPSKRFPRGDISLDSDACIGSGDQVLELYSQYASKGKVLSNDVKTIASGTTHPIHTTFDIAETGRKTSRKPNVQNFRRLPGVRECFVPR
jgi:hypothetical protein